MSAKSQSTRGEQGRGVIRQILASVAVAGLLCAVGVVHVAGKVSTVEAGYQLGQVAARHRQLERQHAQLQLQLATLRSAAHIEHTARVKLGMRRPSPQDVFQVGGPLEPVVPPAPKTRRAARHHAPKRTAMALLDR